MSLGGSARPVKFAGNEPAGSRTKEQPTNKENKHASTWALLLRHGCVAVGLRLKRVTFDLSGSTSFTILPLRRPGGRES